MTKIKRLNWGCGDVRPTDWINADLRDGEGIDISGSILDGLPLKDGSVDYISSQHALQQLLVYDIIEALKELRRVLKPGGVLRMCLPDLDKAIAAYNKGDSEYFLCWDWDSMSGNFITFIMDFNYTRTPLTFEFAEELLSKAGFAEIHRVMYRQTTSRFPEIIELDSRPTESFYVEAVNLN